MTDLSDLLAVLAVALYLSGVGAVTVRALMLRHRQQPLEGRGGVGALLTFLAAGYMLLVLADVPGILTILSNQASDIPLVSSVRTLVLGLWLWVLHALLYRLARGRLT